MANYDCACGYGTNDPARYFQHTDNPACPVFGKGTIKLHKNSLGGLVSPLPGKPEVGSHIGNIYHGSLNIRGGYFTDPPNGHSLDYDVLDCFGELRYGLALYRKGKLVRCRLFGKWGPANTCARNFLGYEGDS
jgi:hypothetical protein